MPRYTNLLLTLATLSATALTCSAQNTYPAGPGNYPTQTQAAPVQRMAPDMQDGQYGNPGRAPMQANITSSRPAPGVFLRSAPNAAVQTVSADATRTELRVDHGVVNVSLHHPAQHAVIQVDLPGGQTDLLKDGLYTFNADTNTVSVLKGEAAAYTTAAAGAKPVKVKEDHQLVFSGSHLRSVDVGPMQASADLLPRTNYGDGARGYGYGGYGYGPYGDGFYGGYPYAYGYPYAFGYPYGYGYPYFGFGLGFGYGGFGGFRGGYGGFHGGFGGRR